MDGKRGESQQLQPPGVKVVEGPCGAWVMGTPVPPQAQPANYKASTRVAVHHIPSASRSTTLNDANHMNYTSLPEHGGGRAPFAGSPGPTNYGSFYGHSGSTDNPYVQVSPVPGSSGNSPIEMILKVLDRCGKKLEDTTYKAGRTAGNIWHHLKTGPSLSDAAMSRLAQGTKVLAEGGHDKIFQQTFGLFPWEQLRKAYACYLSTSTGPVIGTLYVSTTKLAFCSDSPLCYSSISGQQEWTYYKVVIPLDQLRAMNPSTNRLNQAEKYIQICTADGHEFWFMGFVSYDKALRTLTEVLHSTGHY